MLQVQWPALISGGKKKQRERSAFAPRQDKAPPEDLSLPPSDFEIEGPENSVYERFC